jgi:starch-binding outer membrane protein, SusD/RagB family
MNNIHKIIALSFILLGWFGCSSDLLNKTPIDKLSPSIFYQNETQCKMALMGIYNAIQPNATPTHFYQFEFMSDNGYCQAAWQGSNEIGSWSTNSNSWAPGAKWSQDYAIIARVNRFLQDLSTAPLSDDVKAPMIAEAKFLRGYAYSDLITYFGDVPLITKVLALADAYVKRSPKANVLTQVLTDFTEAASVLPTTYSKENIGRATKGAALAYKAKILLYNQKWTEAAQATKDVMDLKLYDFYPNYSDLFTEAHENNSEVIFDIQYIPTTQSQPWPAEPFVLGTWQTSNITADMINSYYMTNGKPITDGTSNNRNCCQQRFIVFDLLCVQ